MHKFICMIVYIYQIQQKCTMLITGNKTRKVRIA